ncbi:MAG: sigma-70 family RNA polymerase sigma factor [Ruminococcaceae bacterium]|nr:sigma-70 family RNA polymerase sigma factor [Oscillospiraceae bacterium]
MEDRDIIELFFKRSESGIAELLKKYGTAMRGISYNILKNHEDSEECVNDACLGVWNAIPPEKPNPLYTFACRITRNVSLARYRKRRAAKRGFCDEVPLEEIADCIPSGYSIDDALDEKALTQALNNWLSGLSKENLYVFMRRFWYMDSSKKVGRDLGVSEAAVNQRVARMKKSLYKYLVKIGYVL